MKCAHCQAAVPVVTAKFCSSCGLPLRDDPGLLVGALPADDSNRNWGIIGGGVLLVGLAVIGIAWLGGMGKEPEVRLRPMSAAAMRSGYYWNPMPAPAPVYSAVPLSPPPPAQYVYNPPPPRPAIPEATLLALAMPPPSHPYLAALYRPRSPGYIYRSLPTVPAAPITPAWVRPGAWTFPAQSSSAPGPSYRYVPTETRDWIYDPVHDTWALRGDRAGARGITAPPRGYPGMQRF